MLAVAEGQRGLITWYQLEAAGVSRKAIRHLVETGWLRRVRRGVYAIGGQMPSPWEDALAVALVAGERTALSHRTAAAIHHFPGMVAPRAVEFSALGPRHPALDGATIHRVRRLDPSDTEERRGVRITTRVRTMVDIAAQLHPELRARLVDEGTIARWWTPRDLLACIDRVDPGRKACARSLLSILNERGDERPVDSILERRIVEILAPYAPFEVHYAVVIEDEVIFIDIAWPRWMVAAEVDSWSIHGRSRRKFDHDRLRNNLLVAHGWRLAHLTSTMDARTILREVGRLLPSGEYVR